MMLDNRRQIFRFLLDEEMDVVWHKTICIKRTTRRLWTILLVFRICKQSEQFLES